MPYLDYAIHGKKKLKQHGFVGTIIMDLSKVYNCLPHHLMIAKLEAYVLGIASFFPTKNLFNQS